MNRFYLAISFRTPALISLALLLYACASSTELARTIPEGDFRERIQTQQTENIIVSAGVPSAKEAKELFGMSLYKKGIQPVWLRIQNGRETSVVFLPVGLDPQYYTALEVANYNVDTKTPPKSLVNPFFLDQRINLRVEPGEELSGFIFTKLDEGTKAFNVDIAGDEYFTTFTFFIPVPGLNIDHYQVDWEGLYPADQYTERNDQQLLADIESFACCVSDKSGTGSGDPLNLIIIGKPMDVYTTFIRAGWDETEAIDKSSMWKTFKSFVSGREYRYSPISSLYVFGRPQDVAFQKARDNIHERNHLRLWMTPDLYHGDPVWIGQISRDIGVRFTSKTITTHKIDPNVDETREFLLEDLAYAQAVKKIGYVKGVGEVPMDQPKGNLTGDPWFTDGYRLVLWVTSEPTTLDEVEALPWRNPYIGE